ncbi:hypothetical protein BC829DRAFT_254066 [Chytridium lagenaria]|nr:hypothetical protein BC829DRAFT_254066 [Chytridium lagenaria]
MQRLRAVAASRAAHCGLTRFTSVSSPISLYTYTKPHAALFQCQILLLYANGRDFWTCSSKRSSRNDLKDLKDHGPVSTYSDQERRVSHDEEEANARIRLGRAVRTLEEDIPNFFEGGFSDTSIYHPSLVFRDPCHSQLSNIVIEGRSIYLGLAVILRWMIRIYYGSIDVDIVRLVQFRGPYGGGGGDGPSLTSVNSVASLHIIKCHDLHLHLQQSPYSTGIQQFTSNAPYPINSTQLQPRESRLPEQAGDDHSVRLMVRWVFQAVPRHQIILSNFNPLSIKPSVFEGVFVYKFDEQGFIVEHVLQSVYPCPRCLPWPDGGIGAARQQRGAPKFQLDLCNNSFLEEVGFPQVA